LLRSRSSRWCLRPTTHISRCAECSAPSNLTTLGIGAIIGTGIFVLTGQASGDVCRPAIVLSMILAGVASGLAALC
jgi:APA family basic amino acid/polyamine antiporter